MLAWNSVFPTWKQRTPGSARTNRHPPSRLPVISSSLRRPRVNARNNDGRSAVKRVTRNTNGNPLRLRTSVMSGNTIWTVVRTAVVGSNEPKSGITDDRSLVSDQPAPPDCRATSNTLPEVTWSLRLPEIAWSLRLSEVTWSLRVLRDHRQRSGVGAVPA